MCVLKFFFGHLAVGKTMAQWGQWQSNICLACQAITETTEHIFSANIQLTLLVGTNKS